jgi:hypothetical protein
MAANPGDHQPPPPTRRPQADGNIPAAANPTTSADDQDCLTPEEVAELSREELALCGPDPDDPQYAEDPDYGPPEVLPYSEAEYAAQLAEEDERARRELVGEAIDAGFTHSLGGNGNGFAAGGPLDEMLPGSDLGWHVIQERRCGLGTLTDDQLIGLLCANRRQASLHHVIETDVVAELDRRRTRADGSPGEHVDQELAAALTLTSWSADRLLDQSRELERLPKTRALLAAGIIDDRRAAIIARHTAVLSGQDAAKVEDMILPRASGMTTGELPSACQRAVIKVDPAAARKRTEKALKDARVEAWLEDTGTAALAGRDLPPAEVIAADKRIDAYARWLKSQGTHGTLEQLRAKVYLALLNDQPIQSLLPQADTNAAATPADSTSSTSATSQTGAGSADSTGPDTTGPAGTGPADTGAGMTGHSSIGHGATGHGAAGPGTAPGPLAGTLHLTIPYGTWTGRSDNPGEIAGYGAADAYTCRDIARQMASNPATRWCVTLTNRNGRPVSHGCARAGPSPPGSDGDPSTWLATIRFQRIETSTCTHQRESTRYQPSNLLRHIIKTRSPRCGYPGCRRAAVRCDDDHTIPYHLGGRTCECNLHPLCRRHHQCKQAPGWHLDQPTPGELIWTTPSGRKYTKSTEPYPV